MGGAWETHIQGRAEEGLVMVRGGLGGWAVSLRKRNSKGERVRESKRGRERVGEGVGIKGGSERNTR